VSIGVGATIDFLAGQVKRAPIWMQRSGTEWIFRLLQEPRRLLRRYVKDLWGFAWCFLAQWWQLQLRPFGAIASSLEFSDSTIQRFNDSTIQIIHMPERLDVSAFHAHALPLDLPTDGRHWLLELSKVKFI